MSRSPEDAWLPAAAAGFSPDSAAPAAWENPRPGESRLGHSASFFREVIRTPRSVGAIAQTSQRLARAIVQASGVSSASRIIELGPGAGAITRQIFLAKPPAARVLAIERNPRFASLLESRFPDLRAVCGCVTELREQAASNGFDQTDAIISALPWTSFPGSIQRDVLESVETLLAPGGYFTTIACLGLHLTTRGRSFRRLLDRIFPDVEVLPVTWRNLPPAFTYRCASTRSRADTEAAATACAASAQAARHADAP